MKKGFTLLIVGFFIIIGCKNEPKTTSPMAQATKPVPGGLSQVDINLLAEQVDFVDFLFYHMEISVSQNEPTSVKTTARFFTPVGKPDTMQCPAIGRISFQAKGKIIKEADIHIGPGCQYFTLIEGKISKGTNLMSPEGANFFQSLVKSYQVK